MRTHANFFFIDSNRPFIWAGQEKDTDPKILRQNNCIHIYIFYH